jgi:hypothetical protein
MIVDEANAPIGIYEYNNGDGANIRGYRARGTVATPSAILANDPITRLSAFGYKGAGFVQRGQISIDSAENWNAGIHWNASPAELIEDSLALDQGFLTENGILDLKTR